MSKYNMTRDRMNITDINDERHTHWGDGEFYEMEEREGEIINVIIATGTK